MFTNECGFLTTLDITIKFRETVSLANRKVPKIHRALNIFIRHYNNSEFYIKAIHCDVEFKSMML